MDFTVAVLDYGTTSLKATLFRLENGGQLTLLASAVRDLEYSYPKDGWIEYPARRYAELVISSLKELLAICPETSLGAISVTGQAETLVLIGPDGAAEGNAIVWLDTRAGEQAGAMKTAIGDRKLYEKTGLTAVDAILPLCKFPWLAAHEPHRLLTAKKALLLKDYVVYALTGKTVTEHSVASCSGLFNIANRDWDDELLAAAGISRALLPDVLPPNAVAGYLQAELCRELRLSGEIPVLCGLLDQCASAIGCGNSREGVLCETTGTVLALAATIDRFVPEKTAFPVVCHGVSGKYLALPYAPTAGMALKWFRKVFVSENDSPGAFAEIDRNIKETTRPNPRLILLPHFCGSVSPWNDPDATGVLYGIGLDTGRYDIARALLEGVGFLLRENLESLEDGGIHSVRVISLGGGAKSPLWLQIKADITGRTIETITAEESTSLGCAMAAAESLGACDSAGLAKNLKTARVFTPDESQKPFYDEKYRTYRKLNGLLFAGRP